MQATQSASERAALAFYATLPFPVAPAQTFAPLLPIHYHAGAGVELEGRPDALCTHHRTNTFIEAKDGKLNYHRDKASSHWALQQEYIRRLHGARDKPYNFLTDYFYRTAPGFLQDHAWNASLFKVLALQALHGMSFVSSGPVSGRCQALRRSGPRVLHRSYVSPDAKRDRLGGARLLLPVYPSSTAQPLQHHREPIAGPGVRRLPPRAGRQR